MTPLVWLVGIMGFVAVLGPPELHVAGFTLFVAGCVYFMFIHNWFARTKPELLQTERHQQNMQILKGLGDDLHHALSSDDTLQVTNNQKFLDLTPVEAPAVPAQTTVEKQTS